MAESRETRTGVRNNAMANRVSVNHPTDSNSTEIVAEFSERYFEHLVDCAKRQVYEKHAARSATNDLVYSVYRSVYRLTRRAAVEFKDGTGFWRWLATRSLSGESAADPADDPALPQLPVATSLENSHVPLPEHGPTRNRRMPTTMEVVELARLIELILTELGPIDQQLFLFRVEGFSHDEVSRQVLLDTATIRDRLEVMRDRVGMKLGARIPSLLD